MSKESFSWLEGVIAAGALVTSAAAVYIAWDQAETMRVEQHASVFPAIQIDPYNSFTNGDGLQFGWQVENAGVGPAFIRSAKLYADDRVLAGLEDLTASVPTGVDIESKQLTGRVIAPGISKDALQLSWRQFALPKEVMNAAYASTADWRLEICYCSTLERCWMTKSGDRKQPERIDRCEIPANGLF